MFGQSRDVQGLEFFAIELMGAEVWRAETFPAKGPTPPPICTAHENRISETASVSFILISHLQFSPSQTT